MIYKKNEFYVGQWDNSNKHGNGVYIWDDGAVLTAEFIHNKIDKGCIMYANNDTYEGKLMIAKEMVEALTFLIQVKTLKREIGQIVFF